MKQLLVVLSFFLALNINAQQLYFSIGGGYNFVLGEQNLSNYNFANVTYQDEPWEYKKIDISLSKGTKLDVGIGYLFGEHFGVELNGYYVFGSHYSSRVVGLEIDPITTRTIEARMGRINPNVVMQFTRDKFRPYAKFGAVMGIGEIEYRETVENSTYNTIFEERLYGGFALGATASLGLKYDCTRWLSLATEVNMVSMSYAPEKGEITAFDVNGVDQLVSMTTYQKEVDYEDHYTYDPYAEINVDAPNKSLKTSYPFGNIGLKFSVVFNLNLKKMENDVLPLSEDVHRIK